MQKFIIHIFLTNSNEQETFAKLLQLLPSYGFKNFVISQNTNKKFQLPIGVYFFQDDLNKNQLYVSDLFLKENHSCTTVREFNSIPH